jgi:hypothetical protein
VVNEAATASNPCTNLDEGDFEVEETFFLEDEDMLRY